MRQITNEDVNREGFTRVSESLDHASYSVLNKKGKPVMIHPLDGNDKLLICDVISRHIRSEQYYKSISSIGMKLGLSDRAVTRRLQRLHKMGYLIVTVNKRSFNQSNTIEVGPSTIKLFIPDGDMASITVSEPVKVTVEPETKTASKEPERIDSVPKAAPKEQEAADTPKAASTAAGSNEPLMISFDAFDEGGKFKRWMVNPKGEIAIKFPNGIRTAEDAGELWVLFGLRAEEGKAWFARIESQNWHDDLGFPVDDKTHKCAIVAFDITFQQQKAKEEKAKAEQDEARAKERMNDVADVKGGVLTSFDEQIPTEVLRGLTYNPGRGIMIPTETDAVAILALYGVPERLAKKEYADVVKKGWPDGTWKHRNLEHLQKIGAGLKADALGLVSCQQR